MAASLAGASHQTLSLFQRVQGLFGAQNVILTSGVRSPYENAAADGANNSQHMDGTAFDFKVKGLNSVQVASAIAGTSWDYGQLIAYPNGTHTHLGVGTKRQNLLKVGGNYVVAKGLGAAKDAINKSVDKIKGKAVEYAARAGMAAATGGTSEVAISLAKSVGGIGGDSCGWFCQFKKWITESEFFVRVGLVFLALIFIGAAFYLMGTGQFQSISKKIVSSK